MREFKYTITDPDGVHARPAGMLVREAVKYQSSITLEKDGKSGDAKRIFSVMGLGARLGQTVSVKIEGLTRNWRRRSSNFLNLTCKKTA